MKKVIKIQNTYTSFKILKYLSILNTVLNTCILNTAHLCQLLCCFFVMQVIVACLLLILLTNIVNVMLWRCINV